VRSALIRHKPVAFDRDLATGFRAAQGFVSAYPKKILTDDHQAGAKFRLPERAIPHPRRQSNTEGATESVGTSVLGSRAAWISVAAGTIEKL
jgi:hypothetical protein